MGIYFELVGFEFNLLLKVVMFLVVFFFVEIIFEFDDGFGFGRIIGGVGFVLFLFFWIDFMFMQEFEVVVMFIQFVIVVLLLLLLDKMLFEFVDNFFEFRVVIDFMEVFDVIVVLELVEYLELMDILEFLEFEFMEDFFD